MRIKGPDMILDPGMAQAIAMSLYELGANAAKYGSLSTAGGQLEIEWSRTADQGLALRRTETGGPPVTPPTNNGFGSRILGEVIEGQLDGKVCLDWRAEGLTCQSTTPLAGDAVAHTQTA